MLAKQTFAIIKDRIIENGLTDYLDRTIEK